MSEFSVISLKDPTSSLMLLASFSDNSLSSRNDDSEIGNSSGLSSCVSLSSSVGYVAIVY